MRHPPCSPAASLAALVLLLALGWAAPLRAAALDRPAWAIVEQAGTVRARPLEAQAWHPLATRHLTPGVEIEVGADGRLVLESGGDRLVAEANSRLVVHSAFERPHVIGQTQGTVRYEIARRGLRRFQVETPLLAITVKGTAFAVALEGAAARVAVDEGAVRVEPVGGTAGVELAAGHALRLDAGGDLAVEARAEGAPGRGASSDRPGTSTDRGGTGDRGARASAAGGAGGPVEGGASTGRSSGASSEAGGGAGGNTAASGNEASGASGGGASTGSGTSGGNAGGGNGNAGGNGNGGGNGNAGGNGGGTRNAGGTGAGHGNGGGNGNGNG
ncbi:MAG: FecR family protein, partial [Geminicoccaceae bacterium]|nr:FecR family protein [Geminicoccaceae bacterium]